MPTGDFLSGRHYFFAHFLYDGLLFFQWVVRTKVLGLEDNLMTNEQKERITTITAGSITDTRLNTTLCGLVNSLVSAVYE